MGVNAQRQSIREYVCTCFQVCTYVNWRSFRFPHKGANLFRNGREKSNYRKLRVCTSFMCALSCEYFELKVRQPLLVDVSQFSVCECAPHTFTLNIPFAAFLLLHTSNVYRITNLLRLLEMPFIRLANFILEFIHACRKFVIESGLLLRLLRRWSLLRTVLIVIAIYERMHVYISMTIMTAVTKQVTAVYTFLNFFTIGRYHDRFYS